MSNTAALAQGSRLLTSTDLGKHFIRWGLYLLAAGFVLGMIPVLHYIHGAQGNIGEDFMKNVTLWWGCPAVLMELTLKAGGLGMIALGLCYAVLPRATGSETSGKKTKLPSTLCIAGLVGATLYAIVAYGALNQIRPNFYFEHHEVAKDIWLAGQGIGIVVFITGFGMAIRDLKNSYL